MRDGNVLLRVHIRSEREQAELLLWSLSYLSEMESVCLLFTTKLPVYSQLFVAGCEFGQLGFDDRHKYTGYKPILQRALLVAIRTLVRSNHYSICDSGIHSRRDR